jgi:hypothetical protein
MLRTLPTFSPHHHRARPSPTRPLRQRRNASAYSTPSDSRCHATTPPIQYRREEIEEWRERGRDDLFLFGTVLRRWRYSSRGDGEGERERERKRERERERRGRGRGLQTHSALQLKPPQNSPTSPEQTPKGPQRTAIATFPPLVPCPVVAVRSAGLFRPAVAARFKKLKILTKPGPGRKFEGLHHFMGEGLLKYLSFKMKVYPRNCLSYIISIFQYENAYCEFLPLKHNLIIISLQGFGL